MLATTIRFIATLVGSLVAFYLAAVVFRATGHLDPYSMQRIDWLYHQLLTPIWSMQWTTQKTLLLVAAALAAQALLLGALFRRWSYRPVARIDPLQPLGRPQFAAGGSVGRLPSELLAREWERAAEEAGEEAEPHERREPVDPAAEERRLLALLERRPRTR